MSFPGYETEKLAEVMKIKFSLKQEKKKSLIFSPLRITLLLLSEIKVCSLLSTP